MTTLTLLLTFFAPSAASAVDLTPWIRHELRGRVGTDIPGVTPDGQPCTFALTDRDDGHYFLVVHLNKPDMTHDEYYGVDTIESQADAGPKRLTWTSANPWGNASSRNAVVVETTSDQRPYQVKGTSDLGGITCILTDGPMS